MSEINESTYNGVFLACNNVWNTANVVYIPNGDIYAEIPNGDGTFSPYQITSTCCNVLRDRLIQNGATLPNNVSPEDIYFDLDKQKCKWANITDLPENPFGSFGEPIKIILNPTGNDGVIFTQTENDTCGLNVKFDYLFKFDCEQECSLNYAENLVLTSTANDDDVTRLRLETDIIEIENKINNLAEQFVNSFYSINCDKFPIDNKQELKSTPVETISEEQKVPFLNTGFGSLLTTDLSVSKTKVAPITESRSVNFCLTEEGLNIWRRILGVNNYINFINGVENSYTCIDVLDIYNKNQEAILRNEPLLIFECDTPFGFKSKINDTILELTNILKGLKTQLENLNIEQNLIANQTEVDCASLLTQFKAINVNFTIDVINDDNTTTQVYSQQMFSIPQNQTVYEYLVSTQNNSGFFVCGKPNDEETWANNCNGLILNEFTNGEIINQTEQINVSSCESIKNIVYQELFIDSGLSDETTFVNSLSPNVLNSNWLTYETTINDQNLISLITNKKIKINLVLNNSCNCFCVLIDQIDFKKVCEDINRTNIFIGKSPGFQLTKIIDNKKSWVDTSLNREFNIAKFDDSNQIRQTNYRTDDERLVINSKEVELTMNMASAVENDVWCFISKNPSVLSGSTCNLTAFTPTDINGDLIDLPTTQTSFVCDNIINLAFGAYLKCAEAVGTSIISIGEICLPKLEITDCGKALKIILGNGSQSFWVTCDKFNGLNYFLILDNDLTQSSIINITDSFLTGDCVTSLSEFIEGVNNDILNFNLNVKQIEDFWTVDECINCGTNTCGDVNINFSGLTNSDITETNTLESFKDFLTKNLTDVKTRKVISNYAVLRAIYDRYLLSTNYGVEVSNMFDYNKMDEFTGLVNNYWNDLIEQVIPATTAWGSVKVYTNTIFDQQKYKYRGYSSFLCNDTLNFPIPPSPINGGEAQCKDVEVKVETLKNDSITFNPNKQSYSSICVTQMNWGSEFVGKVSILNDSNNVTTEICESCTKNVRWYSMLDKPEDVMTELICSATTSAITYTINSITINGVNIINTPISSTTVTDTNINWVEAQNDIISGCTLGNQTGYTYTNFVDFLNDTFDNLGLLEYRAIISLKENLDVSISCLGKNGFYITYPKTDIFSIDVESDFIGNQITYSNNFIFVENGFNEDYCTTNKNINFNCSTGVIIE